MLMAGIIKKQNLWGVRTEWKCSSCQRIPYSCGQSNLPNKQCVSQINHMSLTISESSCSTCTFELYTALVAIVILPDVRGAINAPNLCRLKTNRTIDKTTIWLTVALRYDMLQFQYKIPFTWDMPYCTINLKKCFQVNMYLIRVFDLTDILSIFRNISNWI